MKPEEAIKAVNQLRESSGWQYIRQAVEADILNAAIGFGLSPDMPEKVIDFKRGAIWAANSFAQLPDRLIQSLENEITFNSAKAEQEKSK